MKLVARGLHVSLGARAVLEGVDIAAEPGTLVAVVGPNGAGKSTLLRSLAGLVAPGRGEIRLDARRLDEISPEARARALAYLPQERTVHWPLTARAVIALGRLAHRAPGQAFGAHDAAIVEATIDRMDVRALAERPVTELSGGERARILVARALAGEPKILIADEPTAALDPAHQLALFAVLRGLAGDGAAVVLALHDLSAAAAYCHRIVLLAAGKVLADGPPRAVLTPSLLAAAYGIDARVVDIDGRPVVVTRGVVP